MQWTPVTWGYMASRPTYPFQEQPRSSAAVKGLAVVLGLLGVVLFGQGIWIHAKALLAQVLLERAFAASLAGGHAVKPWPWADTWPVARITVPRLHKSAIVLAGSSGQALAFGPGHVARTPDVGEPGVAVYAAHRDTHFAFRVTGTDIVRWDASGIDADASGQQLVLSTCWPLDAIVSGPLRYVVRAEIAQDISAVAANP